MNGAKLRACLTPCQKCDDTLRVVAQDAISAGNPVEYVSAANGVVTVKKITDATKVYGVSLFDAEAGQTVDIVTNNSVKVDAIVLPDGIARKDLKVDTANNSNLILDWEVL